MGWVRIGLGNILPALVVIIIMTIIIIIINKICVKFVIEIK